MQAKGFCSAIAFLLVSAGVAMGGRPVPTQKTKELLDAKPGLRVASDGKQAIALYRVPIATDSDPSTSTDVFVQNFLANHKDDLGVDNVTLVLKQTIDTRGDKFRVYTYGQTIEGLPVEGSIVKIPVLRGSTDKISYVGIDLMKVPAGALPEDLLSEVQARAVIEQDARFESVSFAGPGQKVVLQDKKGGYHRAWKIPGALTTTAYYFYVDTNTGGVLGLTEAVFHAELHGTVRGYATPGTAADTPENPPQLVSLPGVYVKGLEGSGCPSEGGTLMGDGFTDGSGSYTFGDVTSTSRVVSRLKGQWVDVLDCDGGHWLSECFPNLLLDSELLECQTFDPEIGGSSDLIFNGLPTDPEETAHINAFLGIEKSHDWYKGLQPHITGIDYPLPCIVNADTDGAYAFYYPFGFFGIRQIVLGAYMIPWMNNASMSTALSHEYAHFIQELMGYGIGPFFVPPPKTVSYVAHTEGTAHVFASLIWNVPIIGDGVPLPWPYFMVRIDDPIVRFYDSNSLPTWCRPSSAHCWGLAIAGAFWDLRESLLYCEGSEGAACTSHAGCLSTQLCIEGICRNQCDSDADCGGTACTDLATEKLFTDFLAITNGYMDTRVPLEVLTADDNDGDLSNGTPNQAQIENAFYTLHGWDNLVGGPAPTVTWNIEQLVGLPVPGTDYDVYLEIGPPDIVLRTTEKEGNQVATWFVGRGGSGSTTGGIGYVVTDLESPLRDVTVQVGSHTIANLACTHLTGADLQPADSAHWTNVILETENNVWGPVQCASATGGTGGRVSGAVGTNSIGMLPDVVATSIGIGASSPAELSAGTLSKLSLQSIPEGSRLDATRINDAVVITDDLSGEIEVDVLESIGGVNQGPYPFSPPGPDAMIHVQGDVSATGVIDVTGSGENGLEGGEIIIDGVLAGSMLIKKMVVKQSGDLMKAPAIVIGTLTGNVEVGTEQGAQDLIGSFEITGGGTSTGDILVHGNITGDFVVAGTFDGELCADNIAAGAALPSNVQIAEFGPNATICGEQVCPSLLGVDPSGLNKSRFISFVAPATTDEIAIRVTLASLHHVEPPYTSGPSIPFTAFEGQVRYVGPPVEYAESTSNPIPFFGSMLQCTPHYQDWSSVGLLHVTGSAIVPSSQYTLELVPVAGSVCSAGLTLSTGRWGDIDAPFNPPDSSEQPNFGDVSALVDKFKSLPTAPIKARALIMGMDGFGNINIEPDLGFGHIAGCVDAFRGLPYPFQIASCP